MTNTIGRLLREEYIYESNGKNQGSGIFFSWLFIAWDFYILLVLIKGLNVDLSMILFLAVHGNLYINVSCLYMLISVVLFPLATVVHIYFTMKMYYRRKDDYPMFVSFLMEIMYVFKTLCWKPYKGIDLRWVIRLPKESAHDRKIDVSRWIPRFIETVLWWGITMAVVFSIVIPGNNVIYSKIKQVSNQQLNIIIGASFAIMIIASIIFGLLYHLFDHIRVVILDKYSLKQQLNSHYREVSKPAECTACGGPYPLCRDSCPLFDY